MCFSLFRLIIENNKYRENLQKKNQERNEDELRTGKARVLETEKPFKQFFFRDKSF